MQPSRAASWRLTENRGGYAFFMGAGEAGQPVRAAAVALLEDITEDGVDWRCRLRVERGDDSTLIEVRGEGTTPPAGDVERIVVDRARGLRPERCIETLARMSPLVVDERRH